MIVAMIAGGPPATTPPIPWRIWWCALILLALELGCARTRPAPVGEPGARRVEFSILEDYDKGEALDEIAKDFDLFTELGVTTWRGSFGWDDYEPARGEYDFGWLHGFAELAASRGITLRPYIGYTPAWAAAGGSDAEDWNDPPRDLEDWYRFVRTLAAEMRRHRNIVSYEIYNEENVRQWWDGTADAYARVLRRGADAVEAGNPDAQVLFGGMVFPDLDWVESVCGESDNGPRIDVLPFHAYPETWTPADVRVENYLGPSFASAFAAPADAACGRKPLWINETGFATVPGKTELDQARWWARAVATFFAEPRVEHIGIYEIKDLRADRKAIGDAPNYHLGITRTDRTKKAAFGTLARLVALLGGQTIAASPPPPLEATPAGVEVHRHLFTRMDGRQILFVWTRGSAAVVHVRLPRDAGKVTEYAIDGRAAGQLSAVDRRLEKLALEPEQVRIFEIE
jgi:hypothetical protein